MCGRMDRLLVRSDALVTEIVLTHNSIHNHRCLLDAGRLPQQADAAMGGNGKETAASREKLAYGLHLAEPHCILLQLSPTLSLARRGGPVWLLLDQGFDHCIDWRFHPQTGHASTQSFHGPDRAI